jgi:hypothetical protein
MRAIDTERNASRLAAARMPAATSKPDRQRRAAARRQDEPAVRYESINRDNHLRIKNRQSAPNASKQNAGSGQI